MLFYVLDSVRQSIPDAPHSPARRRSVFLTLSDSRLPGIWLKPFHATPSHMSHQPVAPPRSPAANTAPGVTAGTPHQNGFVSGAMNGRRLRASRRQTQPKNGAPLSPLANGTAATSSSDATSPPISPPTMTSSTTTASPPKGLPGSPLTMHRNASLLHADPSEAQRRRESRLAEVAAEEQHRRQVAAAALASRAAAAVVTAMERLQSIVPPAMDAGLTLYSPRPPSSMQAISPMSQQFPSSHAYTDAISSTNDHTVGSDGSDSNPLSPVASVPPSPGGTIATLEISPQGSNVSDDQSPLGAVDRARLAQLLAEADTNSNNGGKTPTNRPSAPTPQIIDKTTTLSPTTPTHRRGSRPTIVPSPSHVSHNIVSQSTSSAPGGMSSLSPNIHHHHHHSVGGGPVPPINIAAISASQSDSLPSPAIVTSVVRSSSTSSRPQSTSTGNRAASRAASAAAVNRSDTNTPNPENGIPHWLSFALENVAPVTAATIQDSNIGGNINNSGARSHRRGLSAARSQSTLAETHQLAHEKAEMARLAASYHGSMDLQERQAAEMAHLAAVEEARAAAQSNVYFTVPFVAKPGTINKYGDPANNGNTDESHNTHDDTTGNATITADGALSLPAPMAVRRSAAESAQLRSAIASSVRAGRAALALRRDDISHDGAFTARNSRGQVIHDESGSYTSRRSEQSRWFGPAFSVRSNASSEVTNRPVEHSSQAPYQPRRDHGYGVIERDSMSRYVNLPNHTAPLSPTSSARAGLGTTTPHVDKNIAAVSGVNGGPSPTAGARRPSFSSAIVASSPSSSASGRPVTSASVANGTTERPVSASTAPLLSLPTPRSDLDS
jgi:hypothetical protein